MRHTKLSSILILMLFMMIGLSKHSLCANHEDEILERCGNYASTALNKCHILTSKECCEALQKLPAECVCDIPQDKRPDALIKLGSRIKESADPAYLTCKNTKFEDPKKYCINGP
ncbi:unnamed protein product [Amaranthus hypochondriacus]